MKQSWWEAGGSGVAVNGLRCQPQFRICSLPRRSCHQVCAASSPASRLLPLILHSPVYTEWQGHLQHRWVTMAVFCPKPSRRSSSKAI